MKWIVVVGEPRDGFSYMGPFDTEEQAEEARDAIDLSVDESVAWVAELYTREERGV